jgi:hypothetical protein
MFFDTLAVDDHADTFFSNVTILTVRIQDSSVTFIAGGVAKSPHDDLHFTNSSPVSFVCP